MESTGIPEYPALKFLTRYGRMLSWAVGIVPLAGALIAVYCGSGPLVIALCVLACPVLVFVVRLLVELVEVISDTLIPR